MEVNKRNAVWDTLRKYDPSSRASDFIEVTEWTNKDGFDVTIGTINPQNFSMTWHQFYGLKKLVKKLDDL